MESVPVRGLIGPGGLKQMVTDVIPEPPAQSTRWVDVRSHLQGFVVMPSKGIPFLEGIDKIEREQFWRLDSCARPPSISNTAEVAIVNGLRVSVLKLSRLM